MFIEKAYPDELLSSYLFRLSRLNFTSLSNIFNILFATKKLYIKDIDIFSFKDSDLKNNQNILTTNLIKKHQLLQYETYLEESIFKDGRHRWIAPLQRITSEKVFYGTRFCPLCFQEKPYLKMYWRVMLYNICTKHQCYLHNYCPKCNKSLKYPSCEYFQEIYRCYNCNFDLRNIEVNYVKYNSLEIQSQNKLLNILEKGYYKLNNRYYYSIGLFYLLRILIKNIMVVKKDHTYFIEQLTPQELSYFSTYSLLLLKNFPYRLNKFYKKNKLSNMHRILDKYRYKKDLLPNWYLSNIQYNTLSTRWYF